LNGWAAEGYDIVRRCSPAWDCHLLEVMVPTPPKILVVDDQQFVRETVCALLMRQPHWEIYEAADGRAAVDRAREIKPDVVVMDLVSLK